MRISLPSTRMLPSSRCMTPSSPAIVAASLAEPAAALEDVRPATVSSSTLARRWRISSASPRPRSSWVESSPRFSNGNTAIDASSGSGKPPNQMIATPTAMSAAAAMPSARRLDGLRGVASIGVCFAGGASDGPGCSGRTGAMSWYPTFVIVAMNSGFWGESLSTLRNWEIQRFSGSSFMARPSQTTSRISSRSMTSPARPASMTSTCIQRFSTCSLPSGPTISSRSGRTSHSPR